MFRNIPVFFVIWFAFCGLLALAVPVAIITVLLNPQWIGEFAGQIVQGFNATK